MTLFNHCKSTVVDTEFSKTELKFDGQQLKIKSENVNLFNLYYCK